MHKITPHLWYDKEAREAAELYTSIFPNSKIDAVTTLHDTPSGDTDIVAFTLAGQSFMAISAGPIFQFNPSISFHVKCKTLAEVDQLWQTLIKDGKALMEVGSYPFSQRYGWLQDKYGLSWQLMFAGDQDMDQVITPVLMFVGDVCGKAETAANFYASIFPEAKTQIVARYGKGEEPEKEGSVKYGQLILAEQEFGVMDSAREHKFAFNEAISFMISCKNQQEIDYYWEKLSAVPEAEQCGWLKDKFGVSWQVTPADLDKMMSQGSPEQIDRVTKAFLAMKKFNLAELQRAYQGK